jgi:glutamine cyclotransferase
MRFDNKEKFKRANVTNYTWTPGNNFTAGLTSLNDTHYITFSYTERLMHIFEKTSLNLTSDVPYPNFLQYAWGITGNSTHLYVSDGTEQMHLLLKSNLSHAGYLYLKNE